MDPLWKAALWRQLGAAIDMLEGALRSSPDELWHGQLWDDRSMPPEVSEFWYVAYHTLFWLDLYLSGAIEGFIPPPPFTLDELDPAGLLPERPYRREELLGYLAHGRQKARAALEALTDEQARRLCRFSWGEVPYVELVLDTMRHVQEHAAQLNLYLGQQAGLEARWVARARDG